MILISDQDLEDTDAMAALAEELHAQHGRDPSDLFKRAIEELDRRIASGT